MIEAARNISPGCSEERPTSSAKAAATSALTKNPSHRLFNFATHSKMSLVWRGRSKRVSAMTDKVIAQEFVIPTALAIALAAVLSTGAIYCINNYLGPIDQGEASKITIGPIDPRP